MTNQRDSLAQVLVDPVKYSERILGEDLWPTQKEILASIAKPHSKTAVKACHASSKTRTAGEAVNWFMTRYEDGIVATTAPTWVQVKDLTWKEIATLAKKAKIETPPVFTTEWRWSRDHYAEGLSTTEADRFQGYHAPHVLIVLDEAPGVRDPIWEAIDGIEAGGDVRILALGNPTRSSGRFYDCFGKDRRQWNTFTIDGFDTPNMRGLSVEDLLEMEAKNPALLYQNERPYLITRNWVVDKFHQWGTNSPLWKSRVRGGFPGKGEDNLIALDWVEGARTTAKRPGAHCLACDVARYGSNYTAYVELYGNTIVKMWRVQGRSTTDTAGVLAAAYRMDSSLIIGVDDSGVGGGVTDQLRAENVPVIAFNAGSEPLFTDETLNRGSEAYWQLSKAFEEGDIAIGEDVIEADFSVLTEQLVGIEYKFTPRGKIQIFKQGLSGKLPSPDFADALNIAWQAHRTDGFAPASTTMVIEPEPNYLRGERESKLWGGSGGGFGMRNLFGRGTNIDEGYVDAEFTVVDRSVCPSCGNEVVLRELGRSGGTRNYWLECGQCGFKKGVSRIESRLASS